MAQPNATPISEALARVLPEDRVRKLAAEFGVVIRRRKLKILCLVWTLALGFQVGHQRSLVGLRQAYEKRAGHTVVPSGFYKRFTPKMARLIEALALAALQETGPALGIPSGRRPASETCWPSMPVSSVFTISSPGASVGAERTRLWSCTTTTGPCATRCGRRTNSLAG